MPKTLKNTTASGAKKNVGDIKTWGDGDMFVLLSKAFSINEKWMKSTKAMEIDGVGCVVQVTTQQGDNVAEALTFVPNVMILELGGKNGEVVERMLIPSMTREVIDQLIEEAESEEESEDIPQTNPPEEE